MMGDLNYSRSSKLWIYLILFTSVFSKVSAQTGTCTNGTLRLVEGATSMEGRLQICLNDTWGGICYYGWDYLDAAVACRQLNFSSYGAAGFHQVSSGLVYLGIVGCIGTETSLTDCPRSSFYCYSHYYEAGISCHPGSFVRNCTENSTRLVGGSSSLEGRVEVCVNGDWGTVTHDNWDYRDAIVVCRQMGFSSLGAVSLTYAAFGQGTGAIVMDNINCGGNETSLASCPHSIPNRDFHSGDAGVRCQPGSYVGCSENSLRVVGGPSAMEGRLEVCFNRDWIAVITYSWDYRDASVACRQLGFSPYGAEAVLNRTSIGRGVHGSVMSSVNCRGNETTLMSCSSSVYTIQSYYYYAGVNCHPVSFVVTCTENSTRLVGGNSSLEGRVEVCVNGDWGSVTDDYWDYRDASVVCRQLGFSAQGAVALINAAFGQGSGAIVMNNLNCRGDELSFTACLHSIPTHFDYHYEDAGVRCRQVSFTSSCTENSTRLVGGRSSLEGRVEVCVNGDWGTVTHDSWDYRDASVLCRQLGFSALGAVGLNNAAFGRGTGAIVLDNVNCRGTETSIISCQYYIPNGNSHSHDAGVRCKPGSYVGCSENSLRTLGGSSAMEGRIEMCLNGDWIPLLTYSWDYRDASVACRQLGFSSFGAEAVFIGSSIGQECYGSVLSNVNCQGNETTLASCSSSVLTFQSCYSYAGIHCNSASFVVNCTENSTRLVRGNSFLEGRVEVCVNGDWGTVTSDSWDYRDATVVCRQLGFSSLGAVSLVGAAFGEGRGAIVLDNVNCLMNETSLTSCAHSIPSSDYHSEDAGVRCKPSSYIGCSEGSLRVLGGPSTMEGRVEVCFNGAWIAVITSAWSYLDAIVTCRQLGFSPLGAEAFLNRSRIGQGVHGLVMSNVNCRGHETMLTSCPSSVQSIYSGHRYAGVHCQPVSFVATCTENSTRLVGGSSSLEGRVEVCVNGDWGTVTDDYWDYRDASVVCRQLGFSALGAVAVTNAAFGQGAGAIVLDNVNCHGDEISLLSCSHSIPSGSEYHSEDSGVRCKPTSYVGCSESSLRVMEGPSVMEGRVEVCLNGDWIPVITSLWDYRDASVACRQLGFSPFGAEALLNRSYIDSSSHGAVMGNVNCRGDESTLTTCSSSVLYSYRYYRYGGVHCQPISFVVNCTENSTRLVGGRSSLEGRVEVCVNGDWGTVTSDSWDYRDASVVCRHLGFSSLGAIALIHAAFGEGTGAIVLDNVVCRGDESSITSCPHNIPVYDHHSEDAGVRCKPVSHVACMDNSTRLAGGSSSLEGRVEVCVNGDWGTVTDDNWDYLDASVVCRQLNHSSLGALSLSHAAFGQGTGAIVMDHVGCHGNESLLTSCLHHIPSSSDTHSEDAGVRCKPASYVGCSESSLRVVGGPSVMEGRLEVCWNGDWIDVVSYSWDYRDASVACRQLRFSPFGAVAFFNRTSIGLTSHSLVLSSVNCQGNETTLTSCPSSAVVLQNYRYAGVYCQPVSFVVNCTENSTRLVGGNSTLEGRVEVCVNGDWSTVTSDSWDYHDAIVVCRQLGFSSLGAVATTNAFFGEGTGAIVLDYVLCTGNETLLTFCTYAIPGDTDYHSEDAGVRCKPASFVGCSENSLRVVGGPTAMEGRIEVCKNGDWISVITFSWDYRDASVACRQLGFSPFGVEAFLNRTRIGLQHFGSVIGNMNCRGNETTLASCPSTIYTLQSHHRYAGVHCQPASFVVTCTENSTRLVGGTSSHEGRVEVCVNGDWGTVAGNSWDYRDASVVCRQLGFSSLGAVAIPNAAFGEGTGAIVLSHVNCRGNETALITCPHSIPRNYIYHSSDSGVRCKPVSYVGCSESTLRVVGPSVMEGRIEVCLNGDWIAVISSSWDYRDASVACRQLGFSPLGAESFSNRLPIGSRSLGVVMGNFNCQGNETTLSSCSSSILTANWYYRYGGVHCQPASFIATCTENSTRLIGGNSTLEGRVEVCVNGNWGTITSDSWDYRDASTVCRHLGFSPLGAVALLHAAFGEGSGAIVLDNVICHGNESSITFCSHSLPDSTDYHSEDAGVLCRPVSHTACMNNSTRLIGGSSSLEGRVEVCVNGDWGTVTDDLWGYLDASVVCRQLNFSSYGAVAVGNAVFGQGTGAIVMDNVNCRGNETLLISCRHYLPGSSDSHSEDAGVRCKPASFVGCSESFLRVIGGLSAMEGSLEVCLNGDWIAVTTYSWDYRDAIVACRQLGHSSFGAVALWNRTSIGQGNYDLVMSYVNCRGSEATLTSCSSSINMFQSHYRYAGVHCRPASFVVNCTENSTKLVGGNSTLEGRVEVCVNGDWGTVTSDSWDYRDASVVCRHLGYSALGAVALLHAYFGEGTGAIVLDNVICGGGESSLTSCSHSLPSDDYHSEDAGVHCRPVSHVACMDNSTRLVGGNSSLEGRVEVCVNGDWGTVTDDSWDYRDASVVCRQLNHSSLGAVALSHAAFGQGTGAIVMDRVNCLGNETSLASCSHYIPSSSDSHSEDAGVRCKPVSYIGCSESSLRIVRGPSVMEGSLEVCWNGDWIAVTTYSWDYRDASVACRQLGYSSFGVEPFYNRTSIGLATYPFVMSYVNCRGNETTLTSCPSSINAFQSYYRSAGMHCQPASFVVDCTTNSIRLIGGSSSLEGRVEVCVNGDWGTVTSTSWDYRDASVVCRQLGFSSLGAVAIPNAAFGEGTGAIVLSSVNCHGNETSLTSCSHRIPVDYNYYHSSDAGVRCKSVSYVGCSESSLRVVGGPSTMQGRIEVCLNGDWIPVITTSWDYRDASVACRQLGFSPFGAEAFLNRSYIGSGIHGLIMSNVNCRGNETTLSSCSSSILSAIWYYSYGGVHCQPVSFVVNCVENSTRLVGGNFSLEGRVEVCVNGDWGTVTSDSWDYRDASVVCRYLGFSSLGAVPLLHAAFGEGMRAIVLDNVICSGNENSITTCLHSIPGDSDYHTEDAGVRCRPVSHIACVNNSTRLFGGSSSLEGRVEVCVNGDWGTVTDDNWDYLDASVVCRELNHSSFGMLRIGQLNATNK